MSLLPLFTWIFGFALYAFTGLENDWLNIAWIGLVVVSIARYWWKHKPEYDEYGEGGF